MYGRVGRRKLKTYPDKSELTLKLSHIWSWFWI